MKEFQCALFRASIELMRWSCGPWRSLGAPRALLAMLALLAWQGPALAQDIEPRRWTHLPVGTNVAGFTYIHTDGDLHFDPVLELDNVEVETHTAMASYTRAFDWSGKTGRIDVILPYQRSRWSGLLSGVSASTRREGFADPWFRLSLDLVGAPALKGKEYLKHRTENPVNTIVGVGLGVMVPLGEYKKDKLLNLGQKRFIFRPQAGILHTRGPWSYELTGSAFIFTENDDFFGGNELKQDPIFALQSHAIYALPKRYWIAAGAAYGWGGESKINGQSKHDEKGNLLTAISFGFPIGKTQGLKFAYLRGDTRKDVGSDSDNWIVSWSLRF